VIRLAILGFWHVHAADYAAEAQANPQTEIVAAWDDDAARGEARARELGARFHSDLAELLARSDVDGVIVTTKTSAHPDVIVAAAEAGKHVYTEKVLALVPADAQRIVEVVERQGVKLTVSLPRLSHGYTLAIREVLASGELGEVTQVRCRLAHDGAIGRRWLPGHFFDPEEAGGGALVDLGCHPLYLTRLFLGGMPESVSAEYGHVTGHAVDDNAAAILRHRTGALGIAETGFVNPSSPFTIEVHGTDGSLLFGTPEPRLLLRSGTRDRGDDWTELPIPDSGPTPFESWVLNIIEDTTATENVALALDLTILVDAANRSALAGTAIRIGPPDAVAESARQ
jgi:1,5-anhydro-D-fructose reductase (1,5-anhydro-D-mannitol-forming)